MTLSPGATAPTFELPDTEGRSHSFPAEPAPPATVVIVTCNHCPYVIAWNPRLRRAAEDYQPRGVRFLAVNSNDDSRYPADSYERMQQFVRDQGWPIPYLHDESQDVARALGAVATPHVFVFDSEHQLRYSGAPDPDHTDESHEASWLRGALDAVLAGEDPPQAETPARGCSVKWRE
jgi:peroxiredoxin